MGDKARKGLKILGVVALGVATFGIGSFIAAGAGVVAGVISGTIAYSGLLIAGVSLIGLANNIPKTVDETGANSRGTPHADAGTFGCYVFGRTIVHMPLLYEEQTGVSPDRVVHDIFCHAWHEISDYVSMTVASDNGPESVSFSGNAATGAYSNLLWWYRAKGDQSTQPFSGSPFDANNWPSTAIGTGMAMSALVWNVDDDAFIAKFQGTPGRVEIVVDGALLYDPRLDTTAGGSGSARFGDPSTWTFNNGNAVLVLLRFMIGEYSSDGSLIWGRGIEETDYDVDNFIAMANVADEVRDGKPSYRLGGAHLLDGSWEGFVQQWERETGGKVSKPGGVYRVWLPHDDLTPLTTITENDLLAGASIEHQAAASVASLYNTARGRYIDPDQGYKAFTYPEVIESDLVEEDGDRKRVLSYDFSWVQDVEIAQRTARLQIRRSRFQRTWTVPIGWIGRSQDYLVFSVHELNCAETNFEDQLVRVINRRMMPSGAVVLLVQQEDATLYDDTVPLLDPHQNNTVSTRVDRLGTITPRGILTSVYQSADNGPYNVTGTGPIQGMVVTDYSPPSQPFSCTVRVSVSWDEYITAIAGTQSTEVRCETDTGDEYSDDIPVLGSSAEPNTRQIIHHFDYVANDSITLHLNWLVGSPAGPNDATYSRIRWVVEFIKA